MKEWDSMNREEAMEKIQKCLALSSSPNENEAKAALIMARKLMAQYKIGEIRTETSKKNPEERLTSITFTTIRDNWMLELAPLIGEQFCCYFYMYNRYRKKTRNVGFLGFPEDLDVCIPAFEYAVNSIRNCIHGEKFDRDEADSYARGFIKGLGRAYAAQNATKVESSVTEKSLVEIMKVPDEVNEYADKNYNSVRLRLRSYQSRNTFDTGYADGVNHLTGRVENGWRDRERLGPSHK